MSTFKVHKVVSALPAQLQADAVYLVRVGVGFDLYVTDSTGQIAHKVNGGAAAATWADYALRWSTPPTPAGEATSPVAGQVYAYTLGGVTRYRLVPTVYTPANDAFYSSFSNGACTGLIVNRG